MRAIAYEAFGGPEVLREMNLPEPQPQAGELRIGVAAAGVNPVDWKLRNGFAKDRMRFEFPVVPGWEAAGMVTAVGDGVEGWAEGDLVYTYFRKDPVHEGSYAEFLTAPADWCARPPAKLLLSEAGGLALVGLTAWQALEILKVAAGDRVLIHAGAGGVGHLAIQLAKRLGAQVATTASKANHEFVRDLGADLAIDYRDGDVFAALTDAWPDGATAVLDAVGGEQLPRNADALPNGGRLVSIAGRPDPEAFAARDITAQYFLVEPNATQLTKLAARVDQGELRLHVEDVLKLEQAAEAQRRSEDGHVRGKLVLAVA